MTDCAIHCLICAQERSRFSGHVEVVDNSVLLGILSAPEGIGRTLLEELGITHKIANAIIAQPVTKPLMQCPLPFGLKSQQAIQLALNVQKEYSHQFLTSGHLLGGLLKSAFTEGSGVKGSDVIASRGLTHTTVLNQLLKMLDDEKIVDAESKLCVSPESVELISKLNSDLLTVLLFAEQEAQCNGHYRVGTEHLLLALISQGWFATTNANIDKTELMQAIRIAVNDFTGPGVGWRLKNTPLTPRALEAFRTAIRTASNDNNRHVETRDVAKVLHELKLGVSSALIQKHDLMLITKPN